MCLLALVWQQHPRYPFLLAANRDEQYQRPTQAASAWKDRPWLFGGRDQEGGGSWLLASRQGRWACLTNVREPGRPLPEKAPSRGKLVEAAVEHPFAQLADWLSAEQNRFAGFNLLWGDADQAWYFSNRQLPPAGNTPGDPNTRPQRLQAGIHLLSNATLNTSWPKTKRLEAAVRQWLKQESAPPEQLFSALGDRTPAPDEQLPATGVSQEWEAFLSPVFIAGTHYGTRASTLLWRDNNQQMQLWERRFGPHARLLDERQLQWNLHVT